MVVPILRGEHRRYACREENSHQSHRTHSLRRCELKALGHRAQNIGNSHNTQTHPDGVGIEGAGIDIITLTRLVGCGIEVDNKGDTRHHKEQKHHKEVAPVAVELIDKTHQAEQQGQEEVGIAGTVVRHIRGQVILRTTENFVNKLYAREPATVKVSAKLVLLQLHIVLTTHEVPHKVAPEHIAHLIAKEVANIVSSCWLIPYTRTLRLTHNLRVAITHRNPARLIVITAVERPHTGQ